jgi:hypothetical protein
MKTKQCFISNSSSSSFIIAITKSKPCKVCGRTDLDVLNIIKEQCTYDGETEIDAEGKENIIKYLTENWFEPKETIEKLKRYKDTNKQLALVSISQHNELLNNLINNSKNIEIIYTEN